MRVRKMHVVRQRQRKKEQESDKEIPDRDRKKENNRERVWQKAHKDKYKKNETIKT